MQSSVLRNGSITQILVFSLLCNAIVLGKVHTTADDAQDLVLTMAEKIALDKFKSVVLDLLPEDFMKTDFYLIRWIRIANLDITTAKNAIMKNVKWREDNRISEIINENFDDIKQEYRITLFGSRDREGHPIGTLDLGDWDLRGAVLQGKRPRLQRYLMYSLEAGMHELFRAQRESAKPITRGLVLIDAMGSNARQHLCPQCLSILMTWTQQMEFYYPLMFWELILINCPPVTAIGFQAIRPVMSEETQRIMKFLDTNKKVWMQYLDERIEPSQRTPKYGGTKKEE